MNCPGHVQIYKQGLKSHRDLPLRMAEFGACHRNEPSGALYGLMRLRAFVQDDAHIFCTENQIRPEAEQFTKLLFEVYRELGFQDVAVKLSTRPERRVGSDAIWDKAEMALGRACETMGLFYALNQGEGAFYGPKLEFVLRDAIGRDWQCGTLQVDFNMPGRLGASFVDENGEKQAPVMLHRAILGSVERFIGILIEHYEGRLPLWLAPVQLVVATVTAEVDAYARRVAEALQAGGLRVETDLRNRTIRYKVRKHSLAKVPLLVVVGAREAAHGTVSLRRLGSDALETLVLEACVPMLMAEALPPDLRQNG
jgi:threonyl-tRNA synthetase